MLEAMQKQNASYQAERHFLKSFMKFMSPEGYKFGEANVVGEGKADSSPKREATRGANGGVVGHAPGLVVPKGGFGELRAPRAKTGGGAADASSPRAPKAEVRNRLFS